MLHNKSLPTIPSTVNHKSHFSMKKAVLAASAILLGLQAWASRPINLNSPDGHITATIVPGDSLTYSDGISLR